MSSIMTSDIENRISKLKLAKDKFLMPLFEAISNSLQAIEDRFGQNNTKQGQVFIRIEREGDNQTNIETIENGLTPVLNICIEDNGIGFTKDNFKSFLTFDSKYKKGRGGQGEGRLCWLKFFEKTLIKSSFICDNKFESIEFPFCIIDGGVDGEKVKKSTSINKEVKTEVHLLNLKNNYRESYIIQTETIAKQIIKHFISYFIDDNCPQIIIADNCGKIILNNHFKTMLLGDIISTNTNINDKTFNLCYIRFKDTGRLNHKLHLCADKREVCEYNLKDYIPNLYSKLSNKNNEKYYYHVFVYSDCLDKMVKPDRSGFYTQKDDMKLMYELTVENIIEKIISKINEDLKSELEIIRKDKHNRLLNFIKSDSPQYRILLNKKYIHNLDAIKPNKSGKELELELYEQLYKINKEAKKNSTTLLNKNLEKVEDKEFFNNKFKEYTEQLSDVGKAQLALYVTHRKALLELLSKLQKENSNGKYSLEDAVHDTIFPMHKTSDDIDYTQHNLWAIDEKLAYHYYLASDKKLSQFENIDTNSNKRPDIAIFDFPIMLTPDEKINTVTLIEFKRPERDDYTLEDNPINQIITYVKNLRDAKQKSKDGETINISNNTPIYAYIIASITPKLKEIAEDTGYLTISSDALGYFGFHPKHHIYFEIISYKKMIQDAKDRNKILFDKLNI